MTQNKCLTYVTHIFKIRRSSVMNKKYLKPEISKMQVSALENLSATFSELDEFSEFTNNIGTYAFNSAFKEIKAV